MGCKECRYYQNAWSEIGYCKRNAPIIISDKQGEWPIVFKDNWCGEYEGKK